MPPAISLADIHVAAKARLAAAKASKLELAEAVRDCCRDLPTQVNLPVGGHTLKWEDAECDLYGGIYGTAGGLHPRRVLMLDGRLLDEPRVETTGPDPGDRAIPAALSGPVTGWYRTGAWKKYSRLCKIRDEECYNTGGEYEVPKPQPFPRCTLAELREVARALPAVIAQWQVHQHASLEGEVLETQEMAAALRQRPEALMADLLRRVREAVESDWGAKTELARATGIEPTALSRYLSGARSPTALAVLALQAWLAEREKRVPGPTAS